MISFGVVLALLSVDGAVELYDEGGGVAVKVYDEAINDLLAAKTQTV